MRNLDDARRPPTRSGYAVNRGSDPRPGSTQALPAPSPDVVSRRLGDEVVLVHLRTNRIFSLSPTGARFWELLSDGRTRAETERQLAEEYDVSRKEVSAEIDSLVTLLEAEGLVRCG
jgi:hypothetical protein